MKSIRQRKKMSFDELMQRIEASRKDRANEKFYLEQFGCTADARPGQKPSPGALLSWPAIVAARC